VLTKELLGSETARSPRVPVHADGTVVDLSGGHRMLSISGPDVSGGAAIYLASTGFVILAGEALG